VLLHQPGRRGDGRFATCWGFDATEGRAKSICLRLLWDEDEDAVWPKTTADEFEQATFEAGGFACAWVTVEVGFAQSKRHASNVKRQVTHDV
jgi:hypothetical protein